MSPGHCLPTGLANLEKSETIPEIQMPSMAVLDPHFLGSGDQPYYSSNPFTLCVFNCRYSFGDYR